MMFMTMTRSVTFKEITIAVDDDIFMMPSVNARKTSGKHTMVSRYLSVNTEAYSGVSVVTKGGDTVTHRNPPKSFLPVTRD
jgi:hypothetical protein